MTPFFVILSLVRWMNVAIFTTFLVVPAWTVLPTRTAQEPEPEIEVAQDPEEGKRLEADAWAFFEGGDLSAAKLSFEQAVEQGRWQAWRGLAEVARRQGAQTDSMQAFQHLLKHDPQDHATRLELAQMLSWNGEYQASRTHFNYLTAHADDANILATTRQGLADLDAWSGDHRKANEQYLEQLKLNPESPSALKGLGELEFWKGREDHAAIRFRQALSFDPSNQNLLDALDLAEAEGAPQGIFQMQYFTDTADWQRMKVLTGFELAPDALRFPDWRFFFGTEYATFEQADGQSVERTSFVSRQTILISPFSKLTLDFEGGETEGESSIRGGIGLDWEVNSYTRAWVSWRHDDFIDPIGPKSFDRYNSAFTVDLSRGDILQAETYNAGVTGESNDGFGFVADILGGPIEDQNGRFESYLQAHRRLKHGHGWEGIGRVYYHHSDFQNSSPNYFSPTNLDSWGMGWRGEWERDLWSSYADATAFWQAGAVGSWGYQVGAGWDRDWTDRFRTGVHANYLNTDERALSSRYGAFALMFLATLDF